MFAKTAIKIKMYLFYGTIFECFRKYAKFNGKTISHLANFLGENIECPKSRVGN